MSTITQEYEARVASGKIQADPAQQGVLGQFDRIYDALESAAQPRGWFARKVEAPLGLYLWGGVGRGKSMLMDLFVEMSPVSTRRVHFHAFMQEIHAEIHAAREAGVEDAIAPAATKVASETKVLAFDEMQITDITDAMLVGRLFEALFSAGVTIVTTSNRHPDDLYKDGLNRHRFLPFIELLKQKMEVHELISDTDYRQNRLSNSAVYFSPLGPEAHESIHSLWADLTRGDQVKPLTLRVKGRDVLIPQFDSGIGRGRFYDFCAQPLGPGDFLEIAKACKLLIVEDIPALSRSNFNEAKRFVTLIDALYEAGRLLVCSAAAEPEMLYLEGDGSFEFVRTASRLREMQSDTYIQAHHLL